MTSALDMALDDLIKTNKQSSGEGRGRGGRGRARRGRGASSAGPIRKNSTRSTTRPSPYSFTTPAQRAPEGQWDHDLYEEGASVAPLRPNTGIETGTKLFISNLDFGVSNEDIKELFSEIGDIKRSTVHYDRSGRSKGTAEVVYSRRADAVAASKRYNNVQLDGKPMKIEIVGTNLAIPAPPVRVANGAASIGRGAQVTKETSTRGRGGSSRRGRGGSGRGRGGRGSDKSAADLDAELDDYHAEAMQIS
ncbi:hypothetical protein GOP47_0000124 [Adiantum capillus-veneris]|uniref:RRM domain-containing protein n=1 Tax=Adiantum capillus-veneris TaxID=13818 RepID=A0A9D4VCG6_ADICA|nr:hypothetical protein GOP47_0000124 [Adiantum capillus-veneris]